MLFLQDAKYDKFYGWTFNWFKDYSKIGSYIFVSCFNSSSSQPALWQSITRCVGCPSCCPMSSIPTTTALLGTTFAAAWIIEIAACLCFLVSKLFLLLKTTSKLVFLKCSIDSPGRAFQLTLIAHQINSGLNGLIFKALDLILNQHHSLVNKLPSISPKPFLTSCSCT